MRQKSSRHLATTVDLEHVTTYNQINPEQNRPVIGEIAHSNSEPWLNLQNNNQWYMSDSIGSKWSKLWTLAIMVAVLLVLPSSHIRYLACPEIRNPSNWSARASCSSLFLSTRPPLVSLIADFPAVYWSIFPCWLTMSQGLLAVSPSLKIPMDPHVVCSSMLQPPLFEGHKPHHLFSNGPSVRSRCQSPALGTRRFDPRLFDTPGSVVAPYPLSSSRLQLEEMGG